MVAVVFAATAPAGEKVVLRGPNGRFLRPDATGTVRADAQVPGAQETFELARQPDGLVTLTAPGGRFLHADPARGHALCADSPRTEPGDLEHFALVAVGDLGVGLRARGLREFARLDSTPLAAGRPSDTPRPEQTVAIYRIAELSADMLAGFSSGLRDLLVAELAGKQYDKTKRRTREQFLDLPAPTPKDILRTKRRRVLRWTEEQQVQARLDGTPQIEILRMPLLRSYPQRGQGLLMFAVRARVPAAGRVRYRVADLASASTSYQAMAAIDLVGEIRARRAGDELSLDAPELLELRVELHSLRLSNDVLSAVRSPICDLVNHELRDNQAEIRRKANRALAKAFEARQFQVPLLRYLDFP
jgi:hypothetical protein